ncbi:MAG: DMT family transporter [Pseudomonadota bacterium]
MFSSLLIRVAPVIFVLLWATGYVGAKYSTADAEPFTFLAIRFAFTFAILFPFVILVLKPANVDRAQVMHSVLIGCLMQALYLGGIFYAVDRGMAAGISALVVALQPFFTAVLAMIFIGERLSFLKVAFFCSALCGVMLVLFPDFDFAKAIPGITVETMTAALVGTIAISIGAVYQKRCVKSLNLWVSTTAQFAGAAVFTGLCAVLFENMDITWSRQVVLSLAWLIFVLSIGAVGLLMYLIRQGNTSSVASLFFLVPVVAMFMSWVLFDEQLVAMQFVGSAIVVASVALATRIE